MESRDVPDRQLDALLERLDRIADQLERIDGRLEAHEGLLQVTRELRALTDSLNAVAYAALGQSPECAAEPVEEDPGRRRSRQPLQTMARTVTRRRSARRCRAEPR